MAKFIVKTEWSGYSRGVSEYIVEAENEEEAKELYWDIGIKDSDMTVRDDREEEVTGVIKI